MTDCLSESNYYIIPVDSRLAGDTGDCWERILMERTGFGLEGAGRGVAAGVAVGANGITFPLARCTRQLVTCWNETLADWRLNHRLVRGPNLHSA